MNDVEVDQHKLGALAAQKNLLGIDRLAKSGAASHPNCRLVTAINNISLSTKSRQSFISIDADYLGGTTESR